MLSFCFVNTNRSNSGQSNIEYAQYKRKKANTVKVKSHTRKSKSGKVSRVKAHRRSKG